MWRQKLPSHLLSLLLLPIPSLPPPFPSLTASSSFHSFSSPPSHPRHRNPCHCLTLSCRDLTFQFRLRRRLLPFLLLFLLLHSLLSSQPIFISLCILERVHISMGLLITYCAECYQQGALEMLCVMYTSFYSFIFYVYI